jgi:hypothetical protein
MDLSPMRIAAGAASLRHRAERGGQRVAGLLTGVS